MADDKGGLHALASNVRSLWGYLWSGSSLRAMRKAMGLGDTLGALPKENGGTGRAGGGVVRLTESASGNVMTYTCPDSLDNHDMVVLGRFKLGDSSALNFTAAGSVVPVASLGGDGVLILLACVKTDLRSSYVFPAQLRRTSGTTFSLSLQNTNQTGFTRVGTTDDGRSSSYAI